MLKDISPQQHQLEMVTLEQLVPTNHLVRKIDSLITDTHVTPGNQHDSQPYIGRLDRQLQRFELNNCSN